MNFGTSSINGILTTNHKPHNMEQIADFIENSKLFYLNNYRRVLKANENNGKFKTLNLRLFEFNGFDLTYTEKEVRSEDFNQTVHEDYLEYIDRGMKNEKKVKPRSMAGARKTI